VQLTIISGRSRGGIQEVGGGWLGSPYFGQKGKNIEGRKAHRASKKSGPTLNSRSGSAADYERLGINVVGNLSQTISSLKHS